MNIFGGGAPQIRINSSSRRTQYSTEESISSLTSSHPTNSWAEDLQDATLCSASRIFWKANLPPGLSVFFDWIHEAYSLSLARRRWGSICFRRVHFFHQL